MSQNLNRYEKMIKNTVKTNVASQWGNYHDGISKKRERFEKIIKYVNIHCRDAKTAIDISGNQGLFSRKVLKETSIQKIICQDLDEQVIDKGCCKNSDENISYVNYNFMAPIVKATNLMPWGRFKSDIVFSLALLHYLLLSQGFRLDDILQELTKYSRKYVCVEFMPKGLWVHGAEVNVPPWYTQAWFCKNFEKYFTILKEEKIDENSIMFIGQLKNR